MSDFIPSKKTAQDFNDGQQYVGYNPTTQELGDYIEVETVNSLIESALYTQEQADTAVETANEAKTTADGLNAQIISANQTANSANQAAQGALSEVNQVLADKTLLPDVQKNYYNLEEYDSFVSNGDGTGTAARKTYCVALSSLTFSKEGYGSGRQFWTDELSSFIALPENDDVKANFVINSNEYTVKSYAEAGANHDIAISFGGRLMIYEDSGVLNVAGLYLQIELSNNNKYTEKVIENNPIHIANQQEEYYWNNEFKKGLNLTDGVVKQGDASNRLCVLGTYIESGDYTLSISDFPSDFQVAIVVGSSYSQNYPLSNIYDSGWQTGIVTKKLPTGYVGLRFHKIDNSVIAPSDLSNAKIMLTRGSIPYPYMPKNGSIIREKDLSGIQIFPAGVNPAQTIGGDWEPLGYIDASYEETDTQLEVRMWRKL